jgi:hypothetical protein
MNPMIATARDSANSESRPSEKTFAASRESGTARSAPTPRITLWSTTKNGWMSKNAKTEKNSHAPT